MSRPSLHRSITTPYPSAVPPTPPLTHVSAPSPPPIETRARANTTTAAAAPMSVGSVWGGGEEGQGPVGERIYPHASVRHFRRGPRAEEESEGSTSGTSAEWWSVAEGEGTPSASSGFKSAALGVGTTGTGVSSAWGSQVGEGDTPGFKDEERWPMEVRFQYEVSADGENLVVTGQQGELRSCEEEPIHAPGAVQSYGVLIAFDEDLDGNFVVAQVSENSTRLLGLSPATLFALPCITQILPPNSSSTLRDALAILDERDLESGDPEHSPYGFELAGSGWTAFTAVHRPDRAGKPRRAVLELEPVGDFGLSREEEEDEGMEGVEREDEQDERPGMESGETRRPSEEELRTSTISAVRPLKEMVRIRKIREREGASGSTGRKSDLQIVQLLSQVDQELLKATDLETFTKITASVFTELTEFTRAMVYEFDESWNGQVVAEQVDYSKTKDLFHGLHFPAGDIPAQARDLYRINKVRLLYDREAPTARMCCRNLDEIANPLDMSHAFLRAMSPIHIQYLANMGVRSTMSISIVVFGKLWGLVALHHYGTEGNRVSFPMRQLCRLLSDSIGRNVERLTMAKRLQVRKVINTTPSSENPGGYIVATAEDLLGLFNADFGCLSIGEEAKILGKVDNSQELLAVLEYLRRKCYTTVQVTTDVTRDFPDIDYAGGVRNIAGFLTVPLSRGGKDFIVFCRRGQLEHIRWGGNPYKNTPGIDGAAALEPRKSFRAWSETVIGKCKSWTDEQQDTPQVLLLIYGKFIDVWRQKESLLSATRLANLLLLDASKAVRTPLNSIIGYLEIALNGSLDLETRENISTSYAASRTLVHVINDLLDLTRTEEGNELFLRDPFDLSSTIEGALAIHRKEAVRRGLKMEVIESPQGTPTTIIGDPAKIQRIIGCVLSNAVAHTNEGGILIEWGELVDHNVEDAKEKENSIRIGISITDTGVGISDEKLELIFREFEHMSTIQEGILPMEHSPINVGLGLAIVARIVRTIGGQLRVESKLGQGSKFTFVLPFRLPSTSPPSSPKPDMDASYPLYSAFSQTPSESMRAAVPPRVNLNGGIGRPRKGTAASEGNKSELEGILGALSSSHMHPDSTAYSTRTSGVKTPQSSTAATSPPLVISNSYIGPSSLGIPVPSRPELSRHNLGKAALFENSSFLPGEAKVQSLPNFSRSSSAVRIGGSTGQDRPPRVGVSRERTFGARFEDGEREGSSDGKGALGSLPDFSIDCMDAVVDDRDPGAVAKTQEWLQADS